MSLNVIFNDFATTKTSLQLLGIMNIRRQKYKFRTVVSEVSSFNPVVTCTQKINNKGHLHYSKKQYWCSHNKNEDRSSPRKLFKNLNYFLIKSHQSLRKSLEPLIQKVPGGGNVMCVCLYQKSVCKVYRTKGVYCRFIQYVRISLFVQSRRVQLFT